MTDHERGVAFKAWAREPEAAEHCCLSVGEFREWAPTVGIRAKRIGVGKRGRKVYSLADCDRAIAESPEWQPSTNAAISGISVGPRTEATGVDHLERLIGRKLRKSGRRKRPNSATA